MSIKKHDFLITICLQIRGKYYIRGKNKELAKKKGLPLVYDKTALMAVSIFNLSHWRVDVTVSNYLLAN